MTTSASSRGVDSRAAGADTGKLVLRVVLGVLVLLHGISKLPGPPAMIVDMLSVRGLPPALAYGVYVGEIAAPILVIIGLWTRPAALLIAVNLVVAIALVHVGQIFSLGKQGGWALELQGMYLFTAIALAFLGAGRLSVGGRFGPLN